MDLTFEVDWFTSQVCTLINHKFSNETLKSGKKYTWKLKYELHELVDYNGDNCNNDKIYSKDDCVDQIILTESLHWS